MTADIEVPIALKPFLIRRDLRQIVPETNGRVIVDLFEKIENATIGAVDRRRERVVRAFVHLDQPERHFLSGGGNDGAFPEIPYFGRRAPDFESSPATRDGKIGGGKGAGFGKGGRAIGAVCDHSDYGATIGCGNFRQRPSRDVSD